MMNSNRRLVVQTAGLVAGATSLGLAPCALAQQSKEPEVDFAYRVVTPAQPTDAPKGKVEVIEFFWYGCPHCYAFEPTLTPWLDKLPAHISFKRVPAVFSDAWFVHAKLFYALEALGVLPKLHKVVFDTIHKDAQPLSTEEAMIEFVGKHGVDKKKFAEAFRSFGVQGKASRARQIANNFKIDGVPSMGIAGKYVTAPTLPSVGSHEGVLPVVEFLVNKERKA